MNEPKRPTICLAMIVKDESAVIERCLSSALPHIDSWVIVDTGSQDDTCQRIEKVLSGVPGRLEHRPFVDFGTNRTELMELAFDQHATWLLLLDADMTIETDGDLHDLLSQDVRNHMLLADIVGGDMEIGGERPFAMPYLVRGNRHWKFEGVTHEFLTSSGRPRQGRISAVRFHNFADGGSRGDKYERDRLLLEAAYQRNPDDARSLFYLAQTYRHLAQYDVALQHYTRRAALQSGTWDEETFFAQYQVGVLQLESNWPAAVEALLLAWSMRPTRAEPLYHLAFGWRNRQAWSAAYLFASRGIHIPVPDDILFVETSLYRWGLRFERSVAAWYVGERGLAQSDTEVLLADPELPEQWRVYAESNLRLAQG